MIGSSLVAVGAIVAGGPRVDAHRTATKLPLVLKAMPLIATRLSACAAASLLMAVIAPSAFGVRSTALDCQRAASFKLPSGWRQQSSGCALRQGGSFSAWTSTTSWRYRGDVHGPVAQLRPGRILISVIVSRPTNFQRSNTFKPLGPLPLRLSAADEIATEEGEPQIPQYRFFRTVRCQYNLDVRVDFGQAHPTSAMTRDAQRALNGLTPPHWPRRC
jgi:hypothetical protein